MVGGGSLEWICDAGVQEGRQKRLGVDIMQFLENGYFYSLYS